MTAPLAHLHTLAQRTLDAHERRAGELRGRLAPVLAAGAAATALLTPQALAALRTGAPLSTAAFLLTVAAALATVVSMGRLLSRRLSLERIQPHHVRHALLERDALDREPRFHEAMVSFLNDACRTRNAKSTRSTSSSQRSCAGSSSRCVDLR